MPSVLIGDKLKVHLAPGRTLYARPHVLSRMARGGGRGRSEGKKQVSRTASPARKQRKQSSSESCATLSEGNACSKQCAHKPSLTETRGEETVAEKKTKKSKTKAMNKSDRESLLQSLESIDEMILQCEVVTKLAVTFEDNVLLKEFTNVLCSAIDYIDSVTGIAHGVPRPLKCASRPCCNKMVSSSTRACSKFPYSLYNLWFPSW